jgi:hypothetical protein
VLGLIGLIKVQGGIIPLNIETREGCLADPSLVPPRASCPHQAEAILRYPNGRTEVIRGTPQQIQQRVTRATEPLIAAERWRGLGICWWRHCWSRPGLRRSPGSWSAVGDSAPGAWPDGVARPPARLLIAPTAVLEAFTQAWMAIAARLLEGAPVGGGSTSSSLRAALQARQSARTAQALARAGMAVQAQH